MNVNETHEAGGIIAKTLLFGLASLIVIGVASSAAKNGTGGNLSAASASCIRVATSPIPVVTWGVRYTDRNKAWAVASAQGGVWMTNIDPTNPSTSIAGTILPLNNVARAQSDLGSGVGRGAPVYQGATASDTTARQALKCARS